MHGRFPHCLSGALTTSSSTTAVVTSQSVAAVTATWTHAALAFGAGHTAQWKWWMTLLLSFTTGSFLAAVLWEQPSSLRNPRDDDDDDGTTTATTSANLQPLALGAALLVTAVPLLSIWPRAAFALCAAANGLQNSVTSSWTQNLCRSSHMSGLTSDVGTILGQMCRGNWTHVAKLPIFLGLLYSFTVGGYLAYLASRAWRSASLLGAAALYIVVWKGYEDKWWKPCRQMFQRRFRYHPMEKNQVSHTDLTHSDLLRQEEEEVEVLNSQHQLEKI